MILKNSLLTLIFFVNVRKLYPQTFMSISMFVIISLTILIKINIVDFNDKHLGNLVIQPDFKYYQNHEFHKLNQGLNIDKNFNLLHTNICSIGANIRKT